MEALAENKFFLVVLTLAVYLLAKKIQERSHVRLFNPLLITIAVIIIYLVICDVDYDTYARGSELIDFWLKPAIVALGVPLYKQLSTIRKQLVPILLAEIAGCVAGIISVVLVAELLGATREVALSLAAKSVTTPIAIEVTSVLGGIPALTAAVVICVGLFGGLIGFQLMSMCHIKSPIAQGLSMGTAAHAIGTTMAMDTCYRYGAWSSLGLTINGLFTALLTPVILQIMGY